jgi:site-specific recombinase XerD
MQQHQASRTKIHDITDGLRTDKTREEYCRAFNAFFRYTKLTSKEELLKLDPQDIEELIIEYLTEYLLKQRHLKYSSITLYKAATLHFFVINRITLNKDWISKLVRRPDTDNNLGAAATEVEDRAYTDEEIQKLLAAADERFRVVFLLLAATGMRIGGVAELMVGHLSKFSPNPLGINSYLIRVYQQSSREDRYYCFATPELTEAIDSYLDYRKRFGEAINPDSPLIREQFDIEDPWAIKHHVKPLARKTYDKMIARFMKKAGLSFPTIIETGSKRTLKRRPVAQTMGFRKRAMTKMIQAKVDYDCREYLIGHKRSRGLNVSYDRTSEVDRFIEWSKAINLLTVDPKLRLEIKIQKLESERITKEDLEEIRRQWMIDLQKERALISLTEWNALKEQMDKLKELLKPIE